MMSMIITFPIPIVFALLLNSVRSTKYKGVVENVTYMPHFISTVVMVGILRRIFDINTGMINNLVELIPGVNYTLNMFMGGHNFRVLYILSGIWQSTGWGSIIYMAALSSVDPEQHEAATIDGASVCSAFCTWTFPPSSPRSPSRSSCASAPSWALASTRPT